MTPDLIVLDGRIRTMDPARPLVQALAARDGVVLALGDSAAIRALAGPGTRIVDAGGRLVLPGFQDAHIHLLNGGVELAEHAPLHGLPTLDALRAALAAHAARWSGPVVWGAGWSNGYFGDLNLTREVLDAAVPDRPCLIWDDGGHNACINSAAIAAIGLEDGTPDPLNGHFVRDARGRATGMLHEEAILWTLDRLPQATDESLRAGLLAGQAHANRHGITGVIDPDVREEHRRIYAAAEAAGELSLRVGGAIRIYGQDSVNEACDRATAWRALHRSRDFHLHSVKFFMDGGLENRTAAMLDPYADAAGGNAPTMFPPDQTAALFTALDALRFQIHVHCIGDAATRITLDGIAAARAANSDWPALHQIAHCQVVHPEDHPRFAALGVMANLQPLWAANDPGIPDATQAMIGPARTPWTYPFRSLIAAGAPFCINSDWSVSTLNPFEIIGTAVTREPPRHLGHAAPFLPGERLTVEECLLGYTVNAAAASWRGGYSGALKPGYSADLIVLDRDISACDPYAIAETQVDLTLCKGHEVWRAPAFGG